MNANNGFSGEKSGKDFLTTELKGFGNGIQIDEYNKDDHKSNEYGDDFMYFYNKKNSKVFIIKGLDLYHYAQVKKIINNDDFEVFCYSKTNTGTSYNSYKQDEGSKSVILQTKALILDQLNLNK